MENNYFDEEAFASWTEEYALRREFLPPSTIKEARLLFGSVWIALIYLRDQSENSLASSCIREIEEVGDSTYSGSVIRARLYMERLKISFGRITWIKKGSLPKLPADIRVN